MNVKQKTVNNILGTLTDQDEEIARLQKLIDKHKQFHIGLKHLVEKHVDKLKHQKTLENKFQWTPDEILNHLTAIIDGLHYDRLVTYRRLQQVEKQLASAKQLEIPQNTYKHTVSHS